MSQRLAGIRALLGHPVIYDFVQNLMGARKVRRYLVTELIQPKPGMRVLDIGCGTGQLVEFLSAVDYHGFDDNSRYIDHAKKRYSNSCHFHCANVNFAKLDSSIEFDVVIAAGILHHLDDDEVITLLKLAKMALEKSHGKFVAFDPCFDSKQNWVSKILVNQDRGLNVRRAQEYQELAKSVFTEVVGQVVHSRWIPYTRHYMKCH